MRLFSPKSRTKYIGLCDYRTEFNSCATLRKENLMAKKDNTYNAKRTRNWCVLFYPDDLPGDWQAEIKALGFKSAISPLHDKDLYTEENEKKNPENKAGTLKKKHHHAVFIFSSHKTKKQLCELFGSLFGFGDDEENSVKGVQFQKCDSVSGSVQYFVHMNHPKKAQYDIAGIQSFHGFDVEKHLNHELTQEEIRELLDNIQNIIIAHEIYELGDLVEILSYEDDKRLLDAVRTTHRGYFRDYLASRRGIIHEERRKQKYIDEFLEKYGYRYDPQADRIFHFGRN